MALSDPDQDEPAQTERRYRAPALEKGLDILELLARHGRAMTASQISAALDRSMSELFRMIQVLEYKGYIEPAESGEGYELSNKLFTLAMARAPVRTLLEAGLPIMRELSAEVGQACHLAVPSDDYMVVVARIESPGYVGFSIRPGYRRVLSESTSGSVLFAFQEPETREAWLAKLSARASKKTLGAFVESTDAIRARGYAEVASSFVQGVIDLSAPVMGGLGTVAALTIPFLHTFPEPMTVEATIVSLRAAAGRISAELTATH